MILPLWLNGLFRFIVNHIENLVKQTDGYTVILTILYGFIIKNNVIFFAIYLITRFFAFVFAKLVIYLK